MILCICNNVREGETEKYHLIGNKCGKCKEPEMEHWNTIDTCPNCGETLEGDGYSNGDPVRCPNALEEDWWYSEPDSGPWYCDFDETVDFDDEYESENPLERPY